MKMKVILIIVFSLLTVALIAQAVINKWIDKTEQQSYNVIYKDGPFEIRYYPSAMIASVPVNGSYKETSGNGFRLLADYIFGGNEENQKIAMTAPVRMKINTNKEMEEMSFIMPEDIHKDSLPAPNNPAVNLSESNAKYTASITYGGFTNDKIIEEYRNKLINIIAEKGLEHAGTFEVLGYNPPFQLTDRRNEILVELLDSQEYFQE
jgi:hypothetical protein